MFKKQKISRKIFWSAIILGVLAAAFVGIINIYMRSSTQKRIVAAEDAAAFGADCILVLGAGVRSDASPSHMLEDRLKTSMVLHDLGASEKLLMSGDHGREGYNEVAVMKNYAIEHGASSEDVFMDHAGFSTYESLYRAKEIFKADKIVIVSQGYHLYRALYIADRLGIDAIGVAADLRSYAGQTGRDLREAAARVKDFCMCIFKPSPTYLGESIPVSGNGNITND